MKVPKEIILKYENETYSLFTSLKNDKVLFGKEYEPVAVDIPLEGEETYAEVLYNSPVYFVILELKEILKTLQVDMYLEIPFLDVGFDQESTFLKQKSLSDFVGFQESLSLYNDIPVSTLEILLRKSPRSVKARMEFLERISLEGGLVANPIFIDDSSSNADPVDETDQLIDNETESFNEIDQDLLSEGSVDDLTGTADDIITEDKALLRVDKEGIDSGVSIHIESGKDYTEELNVENDDGLFIIDEEVEDFEFVNNSLAGENVIASLKSISDSDIVNVNTEEISAHIAKPLTAEFAENQSLSQNGEEAGNIHSALGKRDMEVISADNPKRIRV